MKRRFLPGRGLCAMSALALMLLSAWELIIRLDAMHKPIRMFFDMAFGENIPLSTAMSYFDFSIFIQPCYLLCCLLTAVLALWLRKRAWLFALMLPVCLLLGVTGYQIEAIPLIQGWKMIRLAPLFGLCAGSFINMAALLPRRRQTEPEPPRLGDAPRLHSLAADRDNDRRSA